NNTLTKGENGVYSKTYTVDGAINDIQFKVVKNGTTWIGDETGQNVTFNTTGAGDFTVYCDGTKAWVEGEIVSFATDLDVESVTVVGNGASDGDGWLNNINWGVDAGENHMTETSDGIYEYEYTFGTFDTEAPEFKFAINDSWTHSFGLDDTVTLVNGEPVDAVYNGQTNLKLEGITAGTTISMVLDLTDFDFNTKTGAKMTITWGSDEPVEGYKLGDANNDGEVDDLDVVLIKRYDAMFDVDDEFIMQGDVDGNGEVDICDATFIQRWMAEIPVKYAIGEFVELI
uniref:dockerin type I repeat-containing protein n=1 Tax=uncultured Ruminococcus sp. TaxID=165186 RepID=UPI00293091EA